LIASAAEMAEGKGITRAYRGWMLFMLLLMNALNLADRQGMAAVVPSLKRDLLLSDTQLGLIQGLGFAIFYTLFGLPIARLAERNSRSKIIAASIAIFSCFSALASRVHGFSTLLLCRIGVGIGDAGLGPPVSSLIGDYYPPNRRASAMTVVWLGAPLGAFCGSVIGGWTAQHADWRTWYLGLAVPGIIAAVREPRRGMFDPGGGARGGAIPSIGVTMRFLFAKKSMRHVLLGAAFAAIGMNGMGQFLVRYLVAVFHIGSAQAGGLLGGISVVGMASGLALGGFGVDRASRRDRRWYVWGPAIGLGLAMFLVPAHIVLFVYYTPTLAIAQNMVDASMRASSAFAAAIVLGLVGIGLGPTLVGFISDLAARHDFAPGDYGAACRGGSALPGAGADMIQACSNASANGITFAMACVALLFVLSSLHFLLAARTLRADLDARYQPPPG
jgi:MFS family permease